MKKILKEGNLLLIAAFLLVLLSGVPFIIDFEGPDVLGEYQADSYTVSRVIDGDTIVVVKDGKEETVRLIGVNSPEIRGKNNSVECYALEAKKYAEDVLLRKKVILRDDPSQMDLDRYGRSLRYVFLEDGSCFNDLLVRNGYAHEYTYQVPYSLQEKFIASEIYARSQNLGLWGSACR